MKKIIFVSTLLFVTASFMGIASYIKYHKHFQEEGLYQPKQKKSVEKNRTVFQAAVPEPDENPNQNKQEEQTAPLPQKKKEIIQKQKGNIIHSPAPAKKEREISYKEFSRAPLSPEDIEMMRPQQEQFPAEVNEEKE